MAKAVLGQKHACRDCGVKFYDMARLPPTCPACGAVLQSLEKARSKRPAVAEVKKVAAPAEVEESDDAGIDEELDLDTDDLDEDMDDDLDDKDENKSESGNDIIEDVTELGEDERDVAGVVNGEDER